MNIEELKLILSTINQVSSDASTAAIVWMALHYGLDFLKTLAVAGVLIGVVYVIARTVSSTSEWAEIGRRIVKAHGGHGGTYTYDIDEKAVERAMLSAAPSQQAPVEQGEPVATVHINSINGMPSVHFNGIRTLHHGDLLYTHPQQASEPMTADQIKEEWFEICSLNVPSLNKALMLASAVERHHQIKGKQ